MASRKTLAILVSGLVVSALGILGVTSAMAADAGPITGIGGKCVDVPGSNAANGNGIWLYDCNRTGAQQWSADGEAFKALGKCLDVNAASHADGAKVQLWDCNGTGAQKWAARNGTLVNTGSGKCLDATGMSSATRTKLQIWTCTGTANQLWTPPGGSTTTPPTTPPTTRPTTPPTTAPTTAPPAPPTTTGPKKGVSTWEFTGLAGAVKDVKASWYYNWGTNNDAMPADAEFVPMIWDENVDTRANLDKVKTEGKTLLGFNEPDMAEQANMTVEQALQLWPDLQATGMRLGSPAVAYGGDTEGGWLDSFMKGAKEKKLRVDFITVHWYGGDFSDAAAGQFMGYVKAVHDRYNLPIWVTEYGLMNFGTNPVSYPNATQLSKFITESTKQLQAASYVERYAYFSLPAVADSLPYGLYKNATSPTDAGVAYRAAG